MLRYDVEFDLSNGMHDKITVSESSENGAISMAESRVTEILRINNMTDVSIVRISAVKQDIDDAS